MVRHVAAVALALWIGPAPLGAEPVVFKVSTASANVYKSPSTGSPIIGHASRGARLEVARELGSWVKIAWPAANDGVGYVHVSTGSIARVAATGEERASASASPRATPSPTSSTAAAAEPAPAPSRSSRGAPTAAPRASESRYMRPPEHLLGLGGHVAASGLELGAAARAWSKMRFGLQVELSRAVFVDDPRRPGTLEFAPSAIYALRDRVSDYWWVRPYVGGGVLLLRESLAGPLPGDPIADNRLGVQAFGGGEFTFAGSPRFAVSADIGYRRVPASAFPIGADVSAIRFDLSGHWYLR